MTIALEPQTRYCIDCDAQRPVSMFYEIGEKINGVIKYSRYCRRHYTLRNKERLARKGEALDIERAVDDAWERATP